MLGSLAPAVALQDLTLAYRRHPAIRRVSGRFEPGSLTAVVGPNGAGKSTLLKGIAGTIPPAGGRVDLQNIRRRDIGYLPQASQLDRSFPITVFDLVSLGLWRRVGILRGIRGAMLGDVVEALEAVGLGGLEDRLIDTLSGGQLQRALFARLLLQDAKLLLLDEPFTAIDSRTVADLLDLIGRWHGEGRTVVAVLHDMDLVREHFPQTLLIARELVTWGRTEEVLTPGNLAAARRLGETWEETRGFEGRRAA